MSLLSSYLLSQFFNSICNNTGEFMICNESCDRVEHAETIAEYQKVIGNKYYEKSMHEFQKFLGHNKLHF